MIILVFQIGFQTFGGKFDNSQEAGVLAFEIESVVAMTFEAVYMQYFHIHIHLGWADFSDLSIPFYKAPLVQNAESFIRESSVNYVLYEKKK